MIPNLYKEAKQIVDAGDNVERDVDLGRISVLDFERWLLFDIKPPAIEHNSPIQASSTVCQYLGLIRDKEAKTAFSGLQAFEESVSPVKVVYYHLLQLRGGYDLATWRGLYLYMEDNSLIAYGIQPPLPQQHVIAVKTVEVKLSNIVAQAKRAERELLAALHQIRINRVIPYAFDVMVDLNNQMFSTTSKKGTISVKAFSAKYLAYCMAKEKSEKEQSGRAIKSIRLAA